MDNKAWSGRPASCVGKKMPQPSGGTCFGRSRGFHTVNFKGNFNIPTCEAKAASFAFSSSLHPGCVYTLELILMLMASI
jgi:hypothetical protein